MTALADDPFDITWDPAAGDLADAEVAHLAADLGTDAIIAEGEAMLAARWDLGVDTRSLVEHDITRPRTPEELALEAGAIADGEARSRARDDDA